MENLEHRIRERAYEIWHANGQTDGRADEHWLTAEREVLSSLTIRAPEAATPTKAQKRQRSAKVAKATTVARSKS